MFGLIGICEEESAVDRRGSAWDVICGQKRLVAPIGGKIEAPIDDRAPRKTSTGWGVGGREMISCNVSR